MLAHVVLEYLLVWVKKELLDILLLRSNNVVTLGPDDLGSEDLVFFSVSLIIPLFCKGVFSIKFFKVVQLGATWTKMLKLFFSDILKMGNFCQVTEKEEPGLRDGVCIPSFWDGGI